MKKFVLFFAFVAAMASGLHCSDIVRAGQNNDSEKPCFAPPPPGTPIIRTEPNFPAEAIAQCIEGFVELEFEIGEDGRPKNIRVIDSKPPDMFDDAAISNLKKVCYRPNDFGDVGLPQEDVRLTFTFEFGDPCVPEATQP